MKKILIRTATGLGLLAILLGFIFLTEISQYFFDAFALALTAICTIEMIKAVKKGGYNPSIIPLCIAFALFYPLMALFNIFGLSVALGYFTALGVSFLLIFCFYIFDSKVTVKDFLATLFILFYPIAMLNLMFMLNFNYGMIPLMIAAAAAMMSDTWAFYFGSLIKGPKIFPKISPKKTYAGCIFGLFGGSFGSLIVYLMFELANLPVNDLFRFSDKFGLAGTLTAYAVLGFAIAIISEIGDLAASRIKREFDLKDYGTTFGSHGGVIDRLDSIIFAILLMSVAMPFIA